VLRSPYAEALFQIVVEIADSDAGHDINVINDSIAIKAGKLLFLSELVEADDLGSARFGRLFGFWCRRREFRRGLFGRQAFFPSR